MTQKEAQEKLIENMKKWQKVENGAIAICSRMLEKTDHPILRMVMETIIRDSQNHYNVQGLIVDSMTAKPMTLSPDDVKAIWDEVEKHNELEKETVRLAKEAIEVLKKSKYLSAQNYLLEYLLADEEKHVMLLENLEKVKDSLYPYN
ncbi:hypothetical protein KQI52_08875 [bacterium]|nr:hypothetical protein [bacterium]